MKEKQKWLRIDDDDGWQIVIPDIDILPHSLTSDEEGKNEVAGLDCPCKPEINFLDKILVHNSFEQIEKIDEATKKLFT